MSHEDKTYENNCDECREYNREFHNQDMEIFVEKNRDMIRTEFQTQKTTLNRLSVVEKDIRWMKPTVVVIGGSLILIFIYLFA